LHFFKHVFSTNALDVFVDEIFLSTPSTAHNFV